MLHAQKDFPGMLFHQIDILLNPPKRKDRKAPIDPQKEAQAADDSELSRAYE